MRKALATLLIAAGLAAALTAATGWCLVSPGEVVVVRRFGRPVDPPGAGGDQLGRIESHHRATTSGGGDKYRWAA